MIPTEGKPEQRKWHHGELEYQIKDQPKPGFPTDYASILKRIALINPVKYARTRNYTEGEVTYLSPYISRGVISTKLVFESLVERGFAFKEMEKLVSELAWRDYFQRVWQLKGNGIFQDLRQTQSNVETYQMPSALLQKNTGITAIDDAIGELEATGYMHNHIRMYIAGIACNMANAHWKKPAEWLYYHLLDGDLASNSCSWQWVAGSFSSKKYLCNQENINRFTGSTQKDSWLDVPYEAFPLNSIPVPLQNRVPLNLKTTLPAYPLPVLDENMPVHIFNHYNIDPLWRKQEKANRILLLEPSHFNQYPVSPRIIEFTIQLAIENIPGIQVYCGEIEDLMKMNTSLKIFSKEHPAFLHYPGQKDSRDWLVPEVSGYFNSFFAYWKKIEKYILRKQI